MAWTSEEHKRACVERLLELWYAHPHLRFGQLLLNALRHYDFYYMRDADLLTFLEQWYGRVEGEEKPAPIGMELFGTAFDERVRQIAREEIESMLKRAIYQGKVNA